MKGRFGHCASSVGVSTAIIMETNFLDRVSLCSLDWLGTCYVDQVCLELTELHLLMVEDLCHHVWLKISASTSSYLWVSVFTLLNRKVVTDAPTSWQLPVPCLSSLSGGHIRKSGKCLPFHAELDRQHPMQSGGKWTPVILMLSKKRTDREPRKLWRQALTYQHGQVLVQMAQLCKNSFVNI